MRLLAGFARPDCLRQSRPPESERLPTEKNMSAPTIRQFQADEWQLYRELRLRALAESPDAFGSTFSRENEFPQQWWHDRLAAGVASATDLPLLGDVDGIAAGLAWGRIEPQQPKTAHLYQVWVAPEARGCGAGRMLVAAVIAWAREQSVAALELCVTCGERPARRLYDRAGFLPVGKPIPIRPGAELLEQPMRLELGNGRSQ